MCPLAVFAVALDYQSVLSPSQSPCQWPSKCIYQHTFKYGFVETDSKNKPCRNVPLKCVLC
ncbi:hypothetical protein BDR07DRAFT_1289653, partial [Suillus spraguei]